MGVLNTAFEGRATMLLADLLEQRKQANRLAKEANAQREIELQQQKILIEQAKYQSSVLYAILGRLSAEGSASPPPGVVPPQRS